MSHRSSILITILGFTGAFGLLLGIPEASAGVYLFAAASALIGGIGLGHVIAAASEKEEPPVERTRIIEVPCNDHCRDDWADQVLAEKIVQQFRQR